ncbi:MAG: hypothetical protein RR325_04925, partial [Bacilli bacterium]
LSGSIHESEWTISTNSLTPKISFYFNWNGRLDNNLVQREAKTRPVFYLEPSINLNGGNGTEQNPYRIN